MPSVRAPLEQEPADRRVAAMAAAIRGVRPSSFDMPTFALLAISIAASAERRHSARPSPYRRSSSARSHPHDAGSRANSLIPSRDGKHQRRPAAHIGRVNRHAGFQHAPRRSPAPLRDCVEQFNPGAQVRQPGYATMPRGIGYSHDKHRHQHRRYQRRRPSPAGPRRPGAQRLPAARRAD